VHRYFTITADKPFELGGQNTAPNPQELLIAALNACLIARYAAGAQVLGIILEGLDIVTTSELGFAARNGREGTVPPGFECLRCAVRITGDASTERLRERHETVVCHSPNYVTLLQPVRIDMALELDR
jgi:uncharacterized OsmC-like protein